MLMCCPCRSPPLIRPPPRLCFVFGTGDFGQFGLGTETLRKISHSRLHAWFETVAKGDFLFVPAVCTLAVDEAGKVWSCGTNDNAALGCPTNHVADPNNPQEILEAEVLETQPMVVQTLVDENFRMVDVSAGNSVSVALGHKGDLRAWGSFRSTDSLPGFNGKPGSVFFSRMWYRSRRCAYDCWSCLYLGIWTQRAARPRSMAHPRCLHHVPVALMPHRRVTAPTDVSITPLMRHAPHRHALGPTWGETL